MSEPFVTIILPGSPRGKGRPRTAVRGSFATIFTDKKTRNYENDLKAAGIKAMEGLEVAVGPLSVGVRAYMAIPASWSRKRRQAALSGDLMPTTGVDLDNIVKMLDGLNYRLPTYKGDKSKWPIVWGNDAQIINLHAMKFYSDQPRLEVEVWKWE